MLDVDQWTEKRNYVVVWYAALFTFDLFVVCFMASLDQQHTLTCMQSQIFAGKTQTKGL